MDGMSECRKTCWMIAGAVGFLVLIVLWWPGSFGFWGALLWAVIIGVIVGFVLPHFRCREAEDAPAMPLSAAAGGSAQADSQADEDRRRYAAAAEEQRAAEAERNAAEENAAAAEAAQKAADEKATVAEAADADAASKAAEQEAAAAEAARKAAEAEAAEAEAARRDAETEAAEAQRVADEQRDAEAASEPVAAEEPATAYAAQPVVSESATPTTGGGQQPQMLAEPRGGKGDDLKKIKGVGAKLESSLNTNGIWHFDQIAAWTAQELAWADENLVTIKGRVSRDDWVGQAKVLAAGGTTEFATRVDKGDVY